MEQLTLDLDFSRCPPIPEQTAEQPSVLAGLAFLHAMVDVTAQRYGEHYAEARRMLEARPAV